MSINNQVVFNQAESRTPSVGSTAGGDFPSSSLSASLSAAEDWQGRITRFYAHYNPACISTVDTILAKYKGNEHALMRVLIKRWGPEPVIGGVSGVANAFASHSSIEHEREQRQQPSQLGSPHSTSSSSSSTASPPKPSSAVPSPATQARASIAGFDSLSASTAALPTTSGQPSSQQFPVSFSATATAPITRQPTPPSRTTLNNSTEGDDKQSNSSITSTVIAAATSGSSSNVPPPDDPRWRSIIEAFLKKYVPHRLSELGSIMSNAKGKEKEALVALQKSYQQQIQQQASATTSSNSYHNKPASSPSSPQRSASASQVGNFNSQVTNSTSSSTAAATTTTTTSTTSATNPNSNSASSYAPASELFFRRRVIRMYQHYRPDKLVEIDKILADPRYANRDYLLQVLQKKYGPEPVSQPLPAETWSPPTSGLAYPGASTIIPWPVRVFYMFLRYKPQEIPDLPRKVEANAGHEGRWMAVLTREFGDEPEPPSHYDQDPDVESNEQVSHFVQKLSSVFSQFSPAMLPVVRAMAKEPSMLPRLEELVSAARDYYLASLDPTTTTSATSTANRRQQQQQQHTSPNRLSSRPSSPQNGTNRSFRNALNANSLSSSSSSSVLPAVVVSPNSNSRLFLDSNSDSVSGYFYSSQDQGSTPRDLVQQAVDLVHQNKLLLQLQEPSDAELMSRLASQSASRAGSFRYRQNQQQPGLYDEAASLLQQPPYEQQRPRSASGGGGGAAVRGRSPSSSSTGGGGAGGGGGSRSYSSRLSGHKNMTSISNNNNSNNNNYNSTNSNNPQTMELLAKNQQLEEMVSQLTTALDIKTGELREAVAGSSRSASSSVGSSVAFVASAAKKPATTQTFNKQRISHATQTAALIVTSDGPASSVEEELENVRSSLSVREHQNRMLRLQLQQYSQELEQKERQLRNALSCVDSLTETVNMRMRENATLKMDQIPTSDASRFLDVVDEIKQTFQLHYQQSKERDEQEMNDYYTLANQMIKHRDESIQELTKALEAALQERKKLVNAVLAASAVETDGEVFRDPNISPVRGGGSPSTTGATTRGSAVTPTSTSPAPAPPGSTLLTNDNTNFASVHQHQQQQQQQHQQIRSSYLEKKVARLEKELARAAAQIQAQNEEHTTLVHALALYSSSSSSSSGREGVVDDRGDADDKKTANSDGRPSSAIRFRFSTVPRAAADSDPFAALLNARQRNASETPSAGVSKDEHLSKIEQLDAARLEAESAKAALAAELHRRSVSLEENEKKRVAAERNLEKMQHEMSIAQQELSYWRNEAEARKKDCNRLVEHVATLSDALQQQKEKISSGQYLFSLQQAANVQQQQQDDDDYSYHYSDAGNNSNSNKKSNGSGMLLTNPSLYTYSEAPDESEAERKMVSTIRLPSATNSALGMDGANTSRAASLSLTRQQWNTQNNNINKMSSTMMPVVNYNNNNSNNNNNNNNNSGGGQDGSSPQPRRHQHLVANPTYTKSNLWSMMYGEDQQKVDRAEEVLPYPSKGYHMEVPHHHQQQQQQLQQQLPRSSSTSMGPGPIVQASLVNNYFGSGNIHNNNNSDSGNNLPTMSSNSVANGFLNYSSSNYRPPKRIALNGAPSAGGNNVTAAASVAIARANIASTTGGIL